MNIRMRKKNNFIHDLEEVKEWRIKDNILIIRMEDESLKAVNWDEILLVEEIKTPISREKDCTCVLCGKKCHNDTYIYTCEEHLDEALDILGDKKGE